MQVMWTVYTGVAWYVNCGLATPVETVTQMGKEEFKENSPKGFKGVACELKQEEVYDFDLQDCVPSAPASRKASKRQHET